MSDEQRQRLARQLANDPDMLTFLTEMFVPEYSAIHKDVEKNIIALSDEAYGKAMKLFFVKRTENLHTIETIKRMGKEQTGKPGAIAPK